MSSRGNSSSDYNRSTEAIERVLHRRNNVVLEQAGLSSPRTKLTLLDRDDDDSPYLASYQWTIESYEKRQERRLDSSVFRAAATLWQLILYPKGDEGHRGHISLYIGATLAPHWGPHEAVHSLWRFTVVNARGTRPSIVQEAQHNFTRFSTNWGFNKLLLRSSLLDPAEGWVDGDGCLQLRVDVRQVVPYWVDYAGIERQQYDTVRSSVALWDEMREMGFRDLMVSYSITEDGHSKVGYSLKGQFYASSEELRAALAAQSDALQAYLAAAQTSTRDADLGASGAAVAVGAAGATSAAVNAAPAAGGGATTPTSQSSTHPNGDLSAFFSAGGGHGGATGGGAPDHVPDPFTVGAAGADVSIFHPGAGALYRRRLVAWLAGLLLQLGGYVTVPVAVGGVAYVAVVLALQLDRACRALVAALGGKGARFHDGAGGGVGGGAKLKHVVPGPRGGHKPRPVKAKPRQPPAGRQPDSAQQPHHLPSQPQPQQQQQETATPRERVATAPSSVTVASGPSKRPAPPAAQQHRGTTASQHHPRQPHHQASSSVGHPAARGGSDCTAAEEGCARPLRMTTSAVAGRRPTGDPRDMSRDGRALRPAVRETAGGSSVVTACSSSPNSLSLGPSSGASATANGSRPVHVRLRASTEITHKAAAASASDCEVVPASAPACAPTTAAATGNPIPAASASTAGPPPAAGAAVGTAPESQADESCVKTAGQPLPPRPSTEHSTEHVAEHVSAGSCTSQAAPSLVPQPPDELPGPPSLTPSDPHVDVTGGCPNSRTAIPWTGLLQAQLPPALARPSPLLPSSASWPGPDSTSSASILFGTGAGGPIPPKVLSDDLCGFTPRPALPLGPSALEATSNVNNPNSLQQPAYYAAETAGQGLGPATACYSPLGAGLPCFGALAGGTTGATVSPPGSLLSLSLAGPKQALGDVVVPGPYHPSCASSLWSLSPCAVSPPAATPAAAPAAIATPPVDSSTPLDPFRAWALRSAAAATAKAAQSGGGTADGAAGDGEGAGKDDDDDEEQADPEIPASVANSVLDSGPVDGSSGLAQPGGGTSVSRLRTLDGTRSGGGGAAVAARGVVLAAVLAPGAGAAARSDGGVAGDSVVRKRSSSSGTSSVSGGSVCGSVLGGSSFGGSSVASGGSRTIAGGGGVGSYAGSFGGASYGGASYGGASYGGAVSASADDPLLGVLRKMYGVTASPPASSSLPGPVAEMAVAGTPTDGAMGRAPDAAAAAGSLVAAVAINASSDTAMAGAVTGAVAQPATNPPTLPPSPLAKRATGSCVVSELVGRGSRAADRSRERGRGSKGAQRSSRDAAAAATPPLSTLSGGNDDSSASNPTCNSHSCEESDGSAGAVSATAAATASTDAAEQAKGAATCSSTPDSDADWPTSPRPLLLRMPYTLRRCMAAVLVAAARRLVAWAALLVADVAIEATEDVGDKATDALAATGLESQASGGPIPPQQDEAGLGTEAAPVPGDSTTDATDAAAVPSGIGGQSDSSISDSEQNRGCEGRRSDDGDIDVPSGVPARQDLRDTGTPMAAGPEAAASVAAAAAASAATAAALESMARGTWGREGSGGGAAPPQAAAAAALWAANPWSQAGIGPREMLAGASQLGLAAAWPGRERTRCQLCHNRTADCGFLHGDHVCLAACYACASASTGGARGRGGSAGGALAGPLGSTGALPRCPFCLHEASGGLVAIRS